MARLPHHGLRDVVSGLRLHVLAAKVFIRDRSTLLPVAHSAMSCLLLPFEHRLIKLKVGLGHTATMNRLTHRVGFQFLDELLCAEDFHRLILW